jgi:small subunit ribosomal protein S16
MSILKNNKIKQKIIRFKNRGTKYYPIYDIVVINKNNKNNGKFIEKLGFFNPQNNNKLLLINYFRLAYWTFKGVSINYTVKKHLVKFIIHN